MSTANKEVKAPQAKEGASELSLIDSIIQEGKMAKDENQQTYAKDLLSEFARQVLDEGMVVDKGLNQTIKERIGQIDQLINGQLNEILHAEKFQKMESAWKGLEYMVKNTETSSTLKLRVLNVSKDELVDDLEKAMEFDQSALFKKIYEHEYGTFGGTPYSVLIGDYYFGRHPKDMSLLERISHVSAAAHAPFVAAADARLFDMDSFQELGNPHDLSKIFESAELAKWRTFRESEDSRFVSLVMPHILLRQPYGPDSEPVEHLNYIEDVNGKDHNKYLWGNAAYALGTRITNAFSKYKWCASIRGVEGGGLVENLPAHNFLTSDGDVELKCPTEVQITDRREKELNDLGFISLVHCKGTDQAAFFGGQTANKPKVYTTDEANENAQISSMLPYILASSRFAHYLKVIMRDKVGSFATKEQIADYLNNWLANYILLADDAGPELKAEYPLREGRVDVTEVEGKIGAYRAIVFLRPHFQLEELTTSIRLVAELPAPTG
ncbi:MAG: type VI secretion system contractile sheath large subunit [Proteobacteria bacterium]|nr:type VI secretion system contractile sheath large subunit [Pseudomonadota bacterium]